jgi:hypothetical protein
MIVSIIRKKHEDVKRLKAFFQNLKKYVEKNEAKAPKLYKESTRFRSAL